MGYVENNLIIGETVVYRGRLHWIRFVKPGLIALSIVAAFALLFYAADLGKVLSTLVAVAAWAAVLVIAAVPVLAAAFKQHSLEFAITNKRVVLKTGFIQSATAEMFLNKIETVGVDQTLTGRILGFGTIVIRGTGGSLEPFHRVAAPLEFRKQLQEQIGKSFDAATRPTSAGV